VNTWKTMQEKLKSVHIIITILITLGYLLGTHLSTINSLKMALVTKADRTELELLDKKLTRIEVKLEEAIMTKRDFSQLSEHLDRQIREMAVTLESLKERDGINGKR
jgi:predicted Holliday junction resolvase-like endonuclease